LWLLTRLTPIADSPLAAARLACRVSTAARLGFARPVPGGQHRHRAGT